MKNTFKIRNVALVAALAAVAATAWAMSESLTTPPATAATQSGTIATQSATTPTVAEPVKENIAPSEPATAPAPRPTPVAEEGVQQPRITIEKRRLSPDEIIQMDVIDTLARAPNLTGKIGVESQDATVRLTGWTTTSGQAFRAGMYARAVKGVKYVQNDIRPRIGGSI